MMTVYHLVNSPPPPPAQLQSGFACFRIVVVDSTNTRKALYFSLIICLATIFIVAIIDISESVNFGIIDLYLLYRMRGH